MTKTKNYIILAIYATAILAMIVKVERMRKAPTPEPQMRVDTVYIDNRTEWARIVDALVEVESHGNPMAVNKSSGASGILQAMPIYVAEANRLAKEERYTLEDRFDIYKSCEMWMLIQQHYNPSCDVEKAIRMHNRGGGDWYYNRVASKIK